MWKPRTESKRADFLIRVIDTNDWSVHDYVSNSYQKLCCNHTVDRLATHDNKKV